MTITTLPTAPSRAEPSTFSARGDALLGALATFVTEANALAVAMNLNDTTATSTTSLAIGTGSKTLTVDTAKSYQMGMSVKIAHDSSNWMHGDVTSYNTGTGALVVNITTILGSGTEVTWTITLSGPASLVAASQTEMETATSNAVALTPLSANWHPGMAKAWVVCGITGNILASHNITSITDDGTGDITVTIGTDFSSANYSINAMIYYSGTIMVYINGIGAGSFNAEAFNIAGSLTDPTEWFFSCFGDQ